MTGEWGNDWERADQLMESASAAAERGNWATAAAMCGEAAECFARIDDVFGQGVALADRGGYLFRSGDFEESLRAYRQAGECAQAKNDMRLSARTLWGRADCLARLDRWTEVAEAAGRGLSIMREYEYSDLLGGTLMLSAWAKYWLDDEDGALQHAREARAAFRAEGNARGAFDADDLAVTVLLFQGRTDEALNTANRNLATARVLDGTGALAYAERRSGEALLASGLQSEALTSFKRARELHRTANRPGEAAVCDTWIGRAHRQKGNFKRAARQFAAAAAALDAVGWDSAREDAEHELALETYGLGRTAEAVALHRELLQPLAAGNRASVSWRDQQALLHFVAGQVRQQDAAGALELLGAVEGLHPSRPSESERFTFAMQAARAWVDWHDGRRVQSVERALDLAGLPDASRIDLPAAWVLEVVGTVHKGQLEGIACLARASAIYERLGEFDRATALNATVIAETVEPPLPAQMWLRLAHVVAPPAADREATVRHAA